MDPYFVFSFKFSYRVYHNSKHVHSYNDHISLCFVFMLHDLITCLDVTFIKTCVYTCTAIEPQIDYYIKCHDN